MKTNVDITGKLSVTAVVALCMAFAPDAKACHLSSAGGPFSGLRGVAVASQSAVPWLALQTAVPANEAERAQENDSQKPQNQIVGMWIIDYFPGTATESSDHAIEQFYGDGNEMINDAGFSPASENLCFGVWKASGPRTFKLSHTGWDFNAMTGTFIGTISLSVTITVDPDGNHYVGKYSFYEVDPSGNVIPDSAAKGIIKGTRFKVD